MHRPLYPIYEEGDADISQLADKLRNLHLDDSSFAMADLPVVKISVDETMYTKEMAKIMIDKDDDKEQKKEQKYNVLKEENKQMMGATEAIKVSQEKGNRLEKSLAIKEFLSIKNSNDEEKENEKQQNFIVSGSKEGEYSVKQLKEVKIIVNEIIEQILNEAMEQKDEIQLAEKGQVDIQIPADHNDQKEEAMDLNMAESQQAERNGQKEQLVIPIGEEEKEKQNRKVPNKKQNKKEEKKKMERKKEMEKAKETEKEMTKDRDQKMREIEKEKERKEEIEKESQIEKVKERNLEKEKKREIEEEKEDIKIEKETECGIKKERGVEKENEREMQKGGIMEIEEEREIKEKKEIESEKEREIEKEKKEIENEKETEIEREVEKEKRNIEIEKESDMQKEKEGKIEIEKGRKREKKKGKKIKKEQEEKIVKEKRKVVKENEREIEKEKVMENKRETKIKTKKESEIEKEMERVEREKESELEIEKEKENEINKIEMIDISDTGNEMQEKNVDWVMLLVNLWPFLSVAPRKDFSWSFKSVRLPKLLKDLILWNDVMATVSHLILGVLLLGALGTHTSIKIIAMAGLFLFSHGVLYLSLRSEVRYCPYENLIHLQIEISSESILGLVQSLINWLNFCLLTIQFILFNENPLVPIGMWLGLLELRNNTKNMDGLTLVIYIFLGIFLVPRLYIDLKDRGIKFWEKVQSSSGNNRIWLKRLIRLLANLLQYVLILGTGRKAYVNQEQQTEGFADDIDDCREVEYSTVEGKKLWQAIMMAVEKQAQSKEKSHPKSYSLRDFADDLQTFQMPQLMFDLLYWRYTTITGVYILLGTLFFALMVTHTFVEVFSLVMLIEFVHLSLYLALRHVVRFHLFEKLMDLRMKIPTESATKITRTVVTWLKRGIATIKYIFFGGNILLTVGLPLCLREMRNFAVSGNCFKSSTYFYFIIFLLPSMVMQFKTYAMGVWRKAQYEKNHSAFASLIIMFIDHFECVPASVSRGQQTDNEEESPINADRLELEVVLESFDRFATSVRKRGNCGRNASICLFRDMQTLDEKGTPSA